MILTGAGLVPTVAVLLLLRGEAGLAFREAAVLLGPLCGFIVLVLPDGCDHVWVPCFFLSGDEPWKVGGV